VSQNHGKAGNQALTEAAGRGLKIVKRENMILNINKLRSIEPSWWRNEKKFEIFRRAR
jgi:hypothetical protein